jgi:hypothetical protein
MNTESNIADQTPLGEHWLGQEVDELKQKLTVAEAEIACLRHTITELEIDACYYQALPPRPVGRPRKHSVGDLIDILGPRSLTSGEFQKRAYEQLDISRATFYRLLERGRKEWCYRQSATDQRWRLISKSQKSL